MHHVNACFPCQVVGDAVWERTGLLGTYFSLYVSETAVLPLVNCMRKKVSLGCSHRIRPDAGMRIYFNYFGGAFVLNAPSGRETKLNFS